jgi:hypothetical protein
MYLDEHTIANGDTLVPDPDSHDDDMEEEDDDDQMDKLSSSPSISDGGSPTSPWPRRVSSLTPVPSLLGTPTREPSSEFDISPTSESRPSFDQIDSDDLRRPQIKSTQPSSGHEESGQEIYSSSPFASSPTHPPNFRNCSPVTSRHHHQWGEYESSELREQQSTSNIADDDVFIEHSAPPSLIKSGFQKSISDMELDAQLLPPQAPVIFGTDMKDLQMLSATEHNLTYQAKTSAIPISTHETLSTEAAGLIMENSSDSSDWETDSDADNNSFDSFTFNDDDAQTFQSSIDSRYFCSGWSGECLQELEDIDFEFVYALHNFVATVEGQANAAKGDTMVLLDDSNSYWWLVRVTKDNTIGKHEFVNPNLVPNFQ